MSSSALYDRASDWLLRSYPTIASGLLPSAGRPECRPFAERVLDIHRAKAGDGQALERGLEAFARISFDFIRLQARFSRRGEYARSESKCITYTVPLESARGLILYSPSKPVRSIRPEIRCFRDRGWSLPGGILQLSPHHEVRYNLIGVSCNPET